jgi:hypothetical protein
MVWNYSDKKKSWIQKTKSYITRKLNQFLNKSWVARAIVFLIITAVGWIPLWVFIGLYVWLDPSTFLQKILLVGLSLVTLGSLQALMGFFWVVLVIKLLLDDF